MRSARAAPFLYVLAPVCGELLSGSTPLRAFVNPLVFLYLSGLYGGGALVVREIVRRRGLGWRAVLLLGSAYGVLEEGLVVTSWFNPYWPDAASLGAYGRALELNWLWALHLTLFHAVLSIAAPIVIAESLFPAIADRPWLGDRALRFVTIWLGIVSVAGLFGFGFVAFREQGYTHPPTVYLLALAAAVVLVRLALRHPRAASARRAGAPSLWRLRLFGFAATAAGFVIAWVGPAVMPVAAVTIAALTGVAAAALLAVGRWASSAAWGQPQRLALASGAIGFLIALAPLVELGGNPTGKDQSGHTLVAGATLIGLVLLSRRPASHEPAAAEASPA